MPRATTRTTRRIRGLPPVEAPRARWLVLGSMPGVASLDAREYYAHPRNAFWDFVERRFQIARARPYAERCRVLAARGVALWDVIGECERTGSLDSAIRAPVVNDFAGLFARQPGIEAVMLNGGRAAQLFRRHVTPPDGVVVHALPSTSPAHTRRDKLEAWEGAFRQAAAP